MSGEFKRDIAWLMDASSVINLADQMTTDELASLGAEVVRTYELDRRNRSGWEQLSESALKLAQQVKETKTFPWADCSNVKHPLITVAGIEFAARAYPEICKSGSVVKCLITGDEPKADSIPGQLPSQAQPEAAAGMAGPGPVPGPSVPQMTGPIGGPGQAGPSAATDMAVAAAATMGTAVVGKKSPKRERADRIECHMNFQLNVEMEEWDEETDRLLHILPVVGQVYRKTYFNPVLGRNVSELVLPSDCVVNKKAKSMATARRITHTLWPYENDVRERVVAGIWLDPGNLTGSANSADQSDDPDAAYEFLEQHCYIDLDGDGYKEPYIVTVHRQTGQVVRVLARWQPENVKPVKGKKGNGLKVGSIKPDCYFTHFGFIPNPDGSLNYLGFGQLLEPINSSVNSALNQLLDAGTLYNAGGGFIGRGARMRGGIITTAPGKWQMIDVAGSVLKDNLVPMPVKEPSSVLFQLLGFLVQAGKEISSVQNILAGDAKLAANMPVGTAMALVEQGLKVFTAIYKRIYRSLTEEFKKLYRLNSLYLEDKFTFFLAGQEDKYEVGKRDYISDDLLVVPVADPNLSTDMQRALKAQALKDLSGRPGLNEIEITRRLVRAYQPENAGEILLTDGQLNRKEPLPWTPPPQPQMIIAQAKAQRLTQQAQEAQLRLQMDMVKFQFEMAELEAKITNLKADSVLKLAKAEDEARADTLESLKMEVDQMTREMEQKVKGVKDAAGKLAPTGLAGPAPAPAVVPGREGGGPVEAGNPTL